MTTVTETFKTRYIDSRYQLNKLAAGACILDNTGISATVTEDGYFYIESVDDVVTAPFFALPVQVFDEGAIAFEPGDKVRVVLPGWAGGHDAPQLHEEGVVDYFDGNYFRVDFPGRTPGFPLFEGEVEKVEPKVSIDEVITSLLIDLLSAVLVPAQRESVENDDDRIAMLLTTQEELDLLGDGSVLRIGSYTYVKQYGSWQTPGAEGTYNILVGQQAERGGVDLIFAT